MLIISQNCFHMSTEEILLYLEVLLLNEVNPFFINVEVQNGFIYIFMAADQFKHYSISERIESVFSLLKYDCPSILANYPVILEAFDESEFTEMMKNAL